MTVNMLVHNAQGRLHHSVRLLEDRVKPFKIVIFGHNRFCFMSDESGEYLRFYDEQVRTLSDVVSVITCVRERDDTRLFALNVCGGDVRAYCRLFGLSYKTEASSCGNVLLGGRASCLHLKCIAPAVTGRTYE
jgi:hypothetical protein